jgi:hypothetical protein
MSHGSERAMRLEITSEAPALKAGVVHYTQNYSFLAWSDEAEQWLVEIDPYFW